MEGRLFFIRVLFITAALVAVYNTYMIYSTVFADPKTAQVQGK